MKIVFLVAVMFGGSAFLPILADITTDGETLPG